MSDEPRYLDDFKPGQIYGSGTFEVTEALVRDFALTYDPQPMHLDPEAGRESVFGALVGSGWQTLAITMRLMVDARLLGGAPIVGVEMNEMRFRKPVRPGDRLGASAEILKVRRSASKPSQGFLDLRLTTTNRDDEVILTQRWTLLVPTRPSRDATA